MNKISIIIPVYNVEKFVLNCFRSIKNQTYNNLQIVVIDDGSFDDSAKMCDCFAAADSRVIVVHNLNHGLSCARNIGIDINMGDFVMFVDGDDFLKTFTVEKMLSRIKNDKTEMSMCDFEYVSPYGKPIAELDNKHINGGILEKEKMLRHLCGENDWLYVTICNKMYSRKSLSNIRFPIGRVREDEFIIHNIINNCSSISIINKKLYCYVQREGSITRLRNFKYYFDASEALYDRCIFYLNHCNFECALYTIKASIENAVLARGKSSSNLEVEKIRVLGIAQKKTLFEILSYDRRLLFRELRSVIEVLMPRFFYMMYLLKKHFINLYELGKTSKHR